MSRERFEAQVPIRISQRDLANPPDIKSRHLAPDVAVRVHPSMRGQATWPRRCLIRLIVALGPSRLTVA